MNWYTEELRLLITDDKTERFAIIESRKYANYRYELRCFRSGQNSFDVDQATLNNYSALAEAKVAGKRWVGKGVTP